MEPVELHCTYDADCEQWSVWFPHPLGGMNVLETFDNEASARVYWEEQINSTDWSEQ